MATCSSTSFNTNRMQYRLVKALSFEHQNVCVVGNDDQSIYRWRGADVRNIRGFQKDFSNTRVVKLEENYRWTEHIVAAALAVIERSEERVRKSSSPRMIQGIRSISFPPKANTKKPRPW